MKKYVTAPALLILVCSFAACGNKDSASPPATGGAVAVAPANPLYPSPPAPTTPTSPNTPMDSSTAQYWCRQNLGQYYPTQGVCKLSQTIQLGWFFGMGTVDMRIPVFEHDVLMIQATGSPVAYIGGASYPSSASFVSRTQGSLNLSASSFKVKSVQITRCYNNYSYQAQCPRQSGVEY